MHPKKQTEIIFDRMAALTALTAASAYDYGIRVWLLFLTAATASLAAEAFCLRVQHRKFQRKNLDAAVSGIVFLMLMPPTVPFSLLIMSCIFAIIIGRGLFGGKENPVIPPAAVGFCFALLNNRSAVTAFPAAKEPLPIAISDSVTLTDGISALWNRSGLFQVNAYDAVTNVPAQPLGSGSVILLMAIALVLMLRRSASAWVVLPAMMITLGIEMLMSSPHTPWITAAGCLLANQFLFAVIFLYADPDFALLHIGGLITGMAAGIGTVIFTRFLFLTDAPVILCVLLSPVLIRLRVLMNAWQAESREDGGTAENAVVS